MGELEPLLLMLPVRQVVAEAEGQGAREALGGALALAPLLPGLLRKRAVQRTLFGKVLIEAEVLRQLLYGLAMVVIMLTRPAGLWPAPKSQDRPDADTDKPARSTDVVAA